MSFFKDWWKGIKAKGFFFSWTRDWPGDEKLHHRNWWHRVSTKEECEKEIWDSLTKKEKLNGNIR